MGMKLNPIRATCMYRRYAYAYRDDHTRMEPVCLRTGRIPGGHSWGICDGAHCPYAGIQVTGNNATMYSSQGEEIGTCRCIETTFVLEPEDYE